MTFVVVYLLRARQFVVVPETWVLDLNNAKLKNKGCNSNQDFLVYCSLRNDEAILGNEPNFNAQLTTTYNGTMDACFICRVKKFYDNYDEAIVYRNRQRRLTPPVYNEARVNERPIPQINHQDLDENHDDGQVDDNIANDMHDETVDQYVAGPDHENGVNDQNIAGPSHSSGAIDQNVAGPSHSSGAIDQNVAGPSNANGVAEYGSTNGTTQHIHEVLLEESNGNDLNEMVIKEEDPLLEPINDNVDLEEIDQIIKSTEYHCEVVDDDITIFFESEQAFKPKTTTLQFKLNDALSGSIPYRDYSGVRAYPIDADGMKEIRLSPETVDKLIEWNATANVPMFDSRFVRTVLVLCIGTKKLKLRQFHPNTLEFIRSLFHVRCGTEVKRLSSFDEIVENYIEELLKKAN